MTLGGEVRERYEFYHNENAGLAPANAQGNNSDLTQRYMLYAEERQDCRHLGAHCHLPCEDEAPIPG
jgi:hypothetical protein